MSHFQSDQIKKWNLLIIITVEYHSFCFYINTNVFNFFFFLRDQAIRKEFIVLVFQSIIRIIIYLFINSQLSNYF
jgi:hypothetical protein